MAKDIKNVDLNAHLTNGTVIRIRASVPARDYAGVQSKAFSRASAAASEATRGKAARTSSAMRKGRPVLRLT